MTIALDRGTEWHSTRRPSMMQSQYLSAEPRTAGSPSKRPARLATLQAGRGLAALAVALFHANVVILPLQIYDGIHGPRLFDIGNAGVEFFFVLSGFIIFIVHRNDLGNANSVGPFLWKRFVRIYPIYWLVMILVLAGHPLVHSLGGNSMNVGWVLRSLALLPTNGFPVLGVAWTLEHEVLFYAAFILIILSPRIGSVLFSAWGIACIAALQPFLRALVHPFPWHFLFSPFNLLFTLGMLSAIAAERIKRVWPVLVLWSGLALFLAAPLTAVYHVVGWNNGAMTICEGVGAAMAVAGLAAGERRRGWFVPLALALLGDASYSIYLIHLPAMKLTAPLIRAIGLPAFIPASIMLALCGGIALAAGVAMHLFAERPLLKLARRQLRRGGVAAFSDGSDQRLPMSNSTPPPDRRRRATAQARAPAQRRSSEAERPRRFRGRRL